MVIIGLGWVRGGRRGAAGREKRRPRGNAMNKRGRKQHCARTSGRKVNGSGKKAKASSGVSAASGTSHDAAPEQARQRRPRLATKYLVM